MASEERGAPRDDRAVHKPLQNDDRALIEACEAYAREAVAVTDTPGLSIALARGGRVIWQQGFGLADIRTQVPMTIGTTFPVGSMGKTFVAVAVLQLVERGLLELHAPVRRYLPDLPLLNPLGEREITVYDLLTYRSGLSIDVADQSTVHEPLEQYLRRTLASPTRREYHHHGPRWVDKVGASYHYSSLGIAILGYLVQRINPERLPFAQYVDEYISGPLGLSASGFAHDGTGSQDPTLISRRCSGYARLGQTLLPTPVVHPLAAPANSLLTTPADFAQLLLAIVNGGRLNGARILNPDSARLMLTPQVEMSEGAEESDEWGSFGLEMSRIGQPDFSAGHGGVQPWGWWSEAESYPHHGAVVVACCNRWDMPDWFNPRLSSAQGLVVEFVRGWLNQDPAFTRRGVPVRPWPWRVSWAMGFLIAERTVGLLGAAGAMDEREIERLAAGASDARGGQPGLWDAQAFRCGARAMRAIAPDASSVRRYLRSGEAPVTTADLPLLAHCFGRRGKLGIPQPFFAASAREVPGPAAKALPAAIGNAAEAERTTHQ